MPPKVAPKRALRLASSMPPPLTHIMSPTMPFPKIPPMSPRIPSPMILSIASPMEHSINILVVA